MSSPPDGSSGQSSARVVMYSTPWCGYCIGARELLTELGVAYEDHDVSGWDARQAIVARTRWRTVPVILIDGRLVGGFDELRALHRRQSLTELLAAS